MKNMLNFREFLCNFHSKPLYVTFSYTELKYALDNRFDINLIQGLK